MRGFFSRERDIPKLAVFNDIPTDKCTPIFVSYDDLKGSELLLDGISRVAANPFTENETR